MLAPRFVKRIRMLGIPPVMRITLSERSGISLSGLNFAFENILRSEDVGVSSYSKHRRLIDSSGDNLKRQEREGDQGWSSVIMRCTLLHHCTLLSRHCTCNVIGELE